MKLKQILIVMTMFFITLTTFFALFIPAMYFNFELLKILSDVSLLESLIVFVLITFGLMFISLTIAGKILFFYTDLCEWDKKLEKTNQKPYHKE